MVLENQRSKIFQHHVRGKMRKEKAICSVSRRDWNKLHIIDKMVVANPAID